MNRILAAFKNLALNQILPPSCCLCRKTMQAAHQLCPECWRSLHFIKDPICDVLGTPQQMEFGGSGKPYISLAALADPPHWDKARAATVYTGAARKLVHQLKYSDDATVSQFMSTSMQVSAKDLLQIADLIIPVPLHWSRLIKRRFNQAAILTDQLTKLSNITQNRTILKRVRRTKSQVGLSRAQRRGNVERAFQINAKFKDYIKHKHIILVDDVRTTGATLNEAARVLKAAGAKRVDVLTFAALPENIEEYRDI